MSRVDVPELRCASVTFDSRGRIVTVCVGLDGPKLLLMDPPRSRRWHLAAAAAGAGRRQPLHRLRRRRLLLPRQPRPGRDPDDVQHLFVVRRTWHRLRARARLRPQASFCRATRSSRRCPTTRADVVRLPERASSGIFDPPNGAVAALPWPTGSRTPLPSQRTGGAYFVTDSALYRLRGGPRRASGDDLAAASTPNTGEVKPGPTEHGRLGHDADAARPTVAMWPSPTTRTRWPSWRSSGRAIRTASASDLPPVYLQEGGVRDGPVPDRRRWLADRRERLRLFDPVHGGGRR